MNNNPNFRLDSENVSQVGYQTIKTPFSSNLGFQTIGNDFTKDLMP